MKKKGFATSAILYTLLLLFIVLLVGILNNLQNKKTILDQLKVNTVNALQYGSELESLLESVSKIESEIDGLKKKNIELENQLKNVYTKTETNNLLAQHSLNLTVINTQEELDKALAFDSGKYSDYTVTEETINVTKQGLSIYGGVWYVQTVYITKSYATQIASTYLGFLPCIQMRVMYKGVTYDWKSVSMSDIPKST